MIGGGGFNAAGNPINEAFIENKGNVYTLDEILTRISYDFEVYGNFCINPIWDRARKGISQINYIDVSKVRMKSDGGYLVSDNWSRIRGNKPVLYPSFSEINRASGSQILWVKDYRPGSEWYSLPEYISAENWIEAEFEISKFHRSQIKGGFHPQLIINFAETPTPEERTEVVRRLKETYAGSDAEKLFVTFSDGKDKTPVITPITLNNSDEKYLALNKAVTEGIMSGHRVVNPSLFGIKTEGELGGKNNILESQDIFNAQYVVPKQKIIEDVFNNLCSINGGGGLTINKFRIETTINPNVSEIIQLLTSSLNTTQKAEMLKLIGYDSESIKKLLYTNES